jgi:hypothetical protein
LENAFFSKEMEEKKNFIERVSEYGTLYVIQDKDNFFKDYTSMVSLTPETTIFSTLIGHDLSVLSYTITLERGPFIVIMGGDFSQEVYYAINTFLGKKNYIYYYNYLIWWKYIKIC